jgi:ABC-type sulfate transport system permease component
VGWPLIEEGMLQPVVFNPSSASRATSEFGSTVLYVAENLAGDTNYLTAMVLSEAIARVFTATYAIGTAMGTFDPLEA